MNKKVIFVFVAAGILLILGGALVLWQLVFTEEPDSVPGDPLNPEDFAAAALVDDSKPSSEQEDPMWNADLFEGDIDNVDPSVAKNAIRDSWRKWPDSTIPYVISSSFNSRERSIIAKAMNEYHKKTCIRFEPRNSERGYIDIKKGSGCSSSVGRTGSRQQVSLGNGCVYSGTVIHEFMHAVGFWHEQSRTDRDEYVTINWKNIRPGMNYNFAKYGQNKIDHLGAKYDTCSVMHYSGGAFAKSWGLKTIVQKQAGNCRIGQRKGFSDTDIRKINTLYECSGYPKVGGGSVTGTTVKPTIRPKQSCKDTHKHCKYWAKTDECKSWKHGKWMLVNCPESCDQCGLDCKDREKACQKWADGGWCDRSPGYMYRYCPKACKRC